MERAGPAGFHLPTGAVKMMVRLHVALPFAPSDPVYGGEPTARSPGIQLGAVALRGEKDTLRISAADMLRLRWNPFYPYLEQRVVAWFKLEEPIPPVVDPVTSRP